MVLDVAEVLWEFLTCCREVRLLLYLKVTHLECPIVLVANFTESAPIFENVFCMFKSLSIYIAVTTQRNKCVFHHPIKIKLKIMLLSNFGDVEKRCLNQIHSHLVLIPRLLAVL